MVDDQLPRKLAAILYADVAGYSRLTGEDEDATHRALTSCLDLFAATIERHGGRVVHYAGDAVLAEFPSATNALRCAVEAQQAFGQRNAPLPVNRRVEFRVGINLGDVIVDREDIYGDGVNVAARLEALAMPGGVCVSESVRSAVGNKLAVSYVFLGEQRVKNIDRPVRAYQVNESSAAGTPAASLPAQVAARPSIAVLPFANVGDDPQHEYFSDGITEDLITGLSYWRYFPVLARNSSFAYKNKSLDITEIGRELGARYVVDGSVRRAGASIRVSVQLVDTETGHHIWAQRYDSQLQDIFALQDRIVAQVVASIEPELSSAEQRRAQRKHPENLDAWDYGLRALAEHYRFTRNGNAEAQRLLLKAVELDPASSYALSLLSLCRYQDVIFGWAADRAATLEASFEAAREAVARDDGDWLAHAMLGLTYLWARHEHELGIEETRRGVELNPSAALGYHLLACTLEFGGQSAQAIPHLHSIDRLDPRYRFKSVALADLALSHLSLRQLDDAIRYAEKAVAMLPANVRARQRLVAALAHAGREGEARAALAKLLELQPDLTLAYLETTYAYKDAGQLDFFVEGLRKAGFAEGP